MATQFGGRRDAGRPRTIVSDGNWWTCLEENGHWVVVVNKEEFQIGFDSWGYREGELRELTLAMVPEPPLVVTAAEIVKGISLGRGKMPESFFTQVRTHLRNFRREGLARSVPHEEWPQLGWQRLNTTLCNPSPETAEPPKRRLLTLSVQTANASEPENHPPVATGRLPATSPVVAEITKPPRSKFKRRAGRLPALGMQEKVRRLLSSFPTTITANEIARRIEDDCGLGHGEVQNAVEAQLLTLRQLHVVRVVHSDGSNEVGWSLAGND